MKHVLPSITFYFLLTLASPALAEETHTVITIGEEEISINGESFLVGPSIEDVEEIWGKPDRSLNLANDIRIWDKLGVRTYSKPGSTFVDSISFTMKEQGSDLAAKSIFTGKIKVPLGSITHHTTVAELKRLGFEQHNALAKFYQLELLSASLLAETDDADGSLVSISMELHS